MRFVQPNLFLYFFLLLLVLSGFLFPFLLPGTIGFYGFILVAAFGGFSVAYYIRWSKKHEEHLVCPVGSNCNAVVTSKYSVFFGIHLEYWGMLYYVVTFLSYAAFVLFPESVPEMFRIGVVFLSGFGFLFSGYLLFVQAFLLREWCIWCLLSALLSILIFLTSLASVPVAISFLQDVSLYLEGLHVFGFLLGMGGSTIALYLFSKFLRDRSIDQTELNVLKSISEAIWVGLVLILMSHVALFVASSDQLSMSGTFLMQTVALFVVLVGGAVLMIIFTPYLVALPFFEQKQGTKKSPLETLRKPLFVTGALTFSSWYFAFVMSYVQDAPFGSLILLYAVVIFVAVGISLAWEKILLRG